MRHFLSGGRGGLTPGKIFAWSGFAVTLVLAGCSSPPTSRRDAARNIAILMTNMTQVGAKRIFDSPYNLVWRAAVDAAQQGDLEILNADRSRGQISVRTGVETMAETMKISVRSLGLSGTEVEAIGRQVGPPGAAVKNSENDMIYAIAANLNREGRASGGTGTQVFIQNHIDRESTTVLPSSGETATTLPSQNRLQNHRGLDKLRDIERRVDDLRAKQREREAALGPEQNEDRRAEIQAEIERLREELRVQEQRLADLDKPHR